MRTFEWLAAGVVLNALSLLGLLVCLVWLWFTLRYVTPQLYRKMREQWHRR